MDGSAAQTRPDRPVLQAVAPDDPSAPLSAAGGQGRRLSFCTLGLIEEEMKVYHIDRFGSVDGIVLRSIEDLRPGPKEVLVRVRASLLNYRDLTVLKGGGQSDKARRGAAVRRRRRGRSNRRRSYAGQNWRPDCWLFPSALVWRATQTPLPNRPARRQYSWESQSEIVGDES